MSVSHPQQQTAQLTLTGMVNNVSLATYPATGISPLVAVYHVLLELIMILHLKDAFPVLLASLIVVPAIHVLQTLLKIVGVHQLLLFGMVNNASIAIFLSIGITTPIIVNIVLLEQTMML
jgi:hypothetical protein